MKVIRVLGVAALLFTLVCAAHALDDVKTARAKYDALAAKVRVGDPNVDWRELRLAAVVGRMEKGYDADAIFKHGMGLFGQEDYGNALTDAQDIEEHDIADCRGHYLASLAFMGLKRNQDADKERKILYAFSQSILKSGDGKSSATAWFAVDMWEEFFLMDVFLEVQLKEHHTLKQGGHYYDIVAVTNKKGKNQILWFNTDTDVEMLGRIGDEAVAQHAAEKK